MLKDRVALVTGAGAGLGRAIVERLLTEGALVAACDLDGGRLAALEAAGGGRVAGTALDVSDEAAVAAWVAEALARFGRIDALVNNAGIMDRDEGVAEVAPALWAKVLAVNLDGPVHAMRHALPPMLAQGGGAVVNVASSAALRGGAAGAAYTVSKHTLIGLTRNTAWTYGPRGVRCNAVAPGAMLTEMARAREGEEATPASERLGPVRASIPAALEPARTAAAVAWLASDEAEGVNGAVLAVDAGWLAG